MHVFGLLYFYQSAISFLYSGIFLAFCIALDSEILQTCESLGFIVRASRKYKFYLLFSTIGMFVSGIVIMNTKINAWEH